MVSLVKVAAAATARAGASSECPAVLGTVLEALVPENSARAEKKVSLVKYIFVHAP